jgi:5-methylcytosine-specific restriction enzyme A
MPSKPYKPCNKQGCVNLTRERYCDEHRQIEVTKRKDYDKQRGTPSQRGYGHKWRKARTYYLSHHPLCVRCGDGATVVDHITPHKGDMGLFWDSSNWQSLCAPCHSRKTAKEDGGFGNG